MQLSILLTLLSLSTIVFSLDVGYFWQINDIHSQWWYKPGSDPKTGCYKGTGTAGPFGDFACDTPDTTTESAFSFMSSVLAEPDFLTFLGDVMPHLAVLNKIPHSQADSLVALKNVTNTMRKYFPHTDFVPVLGNHENIDHQWSRDMNWFYEPTLKMWHDSIPHEGSDSWLKGGYYRKDVNSKLSLIILNTNFYFTFDNSSLHVDDPADQFAWLRDQIHLLRLQNRKAIIYGHVPVGVLAGYPFIPNMIETLHSKLVKILEENIDVITSYHSAHQHSDSFALLVKNNQQVLPVFVAPSVLMEQHQKSGMGYEGNNPAVRLVKYDRETGLVLDYIQYWMNLEASNKLNKAVWDVEYRASEFFGVADLSGPNMYKALLKMAEDPEMLQQYWRYMNVLIGKPALKPSSFRMHLCGIRYLTYADVWACIIGKKDL
ncbi:hypothetical protein RCL1_007213 [Eukaryota sp. TZLM3-RCL]